MRTNLSSVLTRKKILNLFLLFFLNSRKVETGSQFRKCLGDDKIYDGIFSFTSNIGNKTFCCNTDLNSWECVAEPTLNCYQYYPNWIQGQCSRTEQLTFCTTYNPRLPLYNGGLCGGILSDVPTVNKSDCFNLEEVKKALNSPTTVPNFSWMCCIYRGCPGKAIGCTSRSYCEIPTNAEFNISSGLVKLESCGPGDYSSANGLMCFRDSSIWTCVSNYTTNTINAFWPLNSSSCLLQVITEPSETNLYTLTKTQTLTTTETMTTNSETIPNWGTALVGIGSSLTTIGIVGIIRFCQIFTHRTPVMFIPGTGS